MKLGLWARMWVFETTRWVCSEVIGERLQWLERVRFEERAGSRHLEARREREERLTVENWF